MRKTLATLFAVLMLVPALLARNNHDWKHAERLKPGTTVLISLWSGNRVFGRIETADSTALQLKVADPEAVGIYQLQEFARADIRRIVHIRRRKLPDPERWMVIGAGVGGGIGLASGAIYDATHHENYHWFTGALAGSVLGFFGSCAVLAGVGALELFRHNNLVYEDQRTGKMLAN
jgi:hypothetical protein